MAVEMNCPYCEAGAPPSTVATGGVPHTCLPPLPPLPTEQYQPRFECPKCKDWRPVRILGFMNEGQVPVACKTCGTEFTIAYTVYSDADPEEEWW